jgi:outer membrane receptor protein involved in Fe transport
LRLPSDTTTFAVPKIEVYGLERLEVLKGPSSALYGQTEPGGLINMISKRPTDTFHLEALTTFGSFDRRQAAFVVGGPLDPKGEFLYRVVGLGRLSDSQTDFVQDNTPSLRRASPGGRRPTRHLRSCRNIRRSKTQVISNIFLRRFRSWQIRTASFPLAGIWANPGLTVSTLSRPRSAMRSNTISTTTCSSGKTFVTSR